MANEWTQKKGFAAHPVAQAATTERMAFIRKVYMLFFICIAFCAGGAYLGSTSAAAITIYKARWGLWIGFFVVYIACMALRKVKPWNYILLFTLPLLLGLSLAPLIAMITKTGNSTAILKAGLSAVGVFGALTAWVFISKKDFSFLGGFLFVGIIALILTIILHLIWPSPILQTVLIGLGLLIFSGYVLFDTSRVMKKLATDEYVEGALSLFIDFFYIFYYLLLLFLSGDR